MKATSDMLNVALQEVKIYMDSMEKTSEEINILAYWLFRVFIIIIGALLIFIFLKGDVIPNYILYSCFIFIIPTFISIICLLQVFKKGFIREVRGSQMKGLQLINNKQDAYKDIDEIKFHLIKEYRKKAELNNKKNKEKQTLINWAIFLTSLGFVCSLIWIL